MSLLQHSKFYNTRWKGNFATGDMFTLGNLGVGVDNPIYRLDISGNVRAQKFIGKIDYTDVSGTPTNVSSFNFDVSLNYVSQIFNKPVLFSGAYNDLSGKPTIPSTISQLTMDTSWNYNTQVYNKPTIVNTFNTRSGAVILTSTDISTALTYTPLNQASYTANDVLSKLLTVDGSGSLLDADLLDGLNSSQFLRSDTNSTSTGTITASRFISNIITGTQPFQVSSQTRVDNLNAQFLDYGDSAYFRNVNNMNAGTLAVARGGTGSNTLTANKLLVGNDTSIIAPLNLHWDTTNSRLGIGSLTPAYPLDVNGIVEADRFISSVATGTPPITVSSTTECTNLNAAKVGGYTALDLRNAANHYGTPLMRILQSTYTNLTTTPSTLLDFTVQPYRTVYISLVLFWQVTDISGGATASRPIFRFNRGSGTATLLYTNFTTDNRGATPLFSSGQFGIAFDSGSFITTITSPSTNTIYRTQIEGFLNNPNTISNSTINLQFYNGNARTTLTIHRAALTGVREGSSFI